VCTTFMQLTTFQTTKSTLRRSGCSQSLSRAPPPDPLPQQPIATRRQLSFSLSLSLSLSL